MITSNANKKNACSNINTSVCSDITGYFFPFNTEHTQKIPPVCHRHNSNNEINFVFVIVIRLCGVFSQFYNCLKCP